MSQSNFPDDFDPFDDEDLKLPSVDEAKRLTVQYHKWRDIDQTIQSLEAQLEVARAEKRRIEEKVVPEIFAEIGIDSIEIDGKKISIKEKLYGGLPKDEIGKENAITHIVDHKGGNIVKVGVDLRFGKGDYEKAMELYKKLEQEGFEPDMGETVHPSTLKSWANERLEAGDDIDLNLIGLYHRKFMEVK